MKALLSGAAALTISVLGWSGQAAACPNPALADAAVSAASSQLYTPLRQPVTATGGSNLRSCALGGFEGYAATRAHVALDFDNRDGFALEMRAQGGCDTLLLVRSPDGRWHFDDDSAGNLQPRLRFDRAGSGAYQAWVGTAAGGACEATLVFETFR